MKGLPYPWFAPKMQVFESGEVQDMCGEDVSFCLDAKKAGFSILCDPRIRVGHEKVLVLFEVKNYGNANKTGDFIESRPKNTRQGNGKHTKYAASSRNKGSSVIEDKGKVKCL